MYIYSVNCKMIRIIILGKSILVYVCHTYFNLHNILDSHSDLFLFLIHKYTFNKILK